MGTYVRPTTLCHALECRAAGAEILAGGTDFWPVRVGKPAYSTSATEILDLGGLVGLRGIVQIDAGFRIGALTTWTDIAEAKLPAAFKALQLAAREVGGRQIQNRGTIAGNLCNASPAADGVPPLLALDASVELASLHCTRSVPLAEFLIGPRRTALQPDEVMTALLIPMPHLEARSFFVKVGARKYQLISIVMGAAVWRVQNTRLASVAISIGACSPVAQRLSALEQVLVGAPAKDVDRLVLPEHLSALAPIDDIRADAAYRHEAATVVVRRLLAEIAGRS